MTAQRCAGGSRAALATRGVFGHVVVLAVLFTLIGCGGGYKVRSDSSTTADFSSYKTYGFFDPMGIEGGYNSPIFGELFRAEIAREMESRGYRQANDPDLIINVTARIDDQVKMTMYTTPYLSGYYYDRPGGAYYGSGLGAGVGVSQRATRTEQISVFIDLVDNAADRIAWQGVAEFEGSDKKARELELAINTITSKILAQYPYRAGQ